MRTYSVRAKRWEHGWELHIEGVGVTQSHGLKDAEMMKLYRQHVLKEEPKADMVSISEIKPATPLATIKPAPKPVAKPVEDREEVGSFGD